MQLMARNCIRCRMIDVYRATRLTQAYARHYGRRDCTNASCESASRYYYTVDEAKAINSCRAAALLR